MKQLHPFSCLNIDRALFEQGTDDQVDSQTDKQTAGQLQSAKLPTTSGSIYIAGVSKEVGEEPIILVRILKVEHRERGGGMRKQHLRKGVIRFKCKTESACRALS